MAAKDSEIAFGRRMMAPDRAPERDDNMPSLEQRIRQARQRNIVCTDSLLILMMDRLDDLDRRLKKLEVIKEEAFQVVRTAVFRNDEQTE